MRLAHCRRFPPCIFSLYPSTSRIVYELLLSFLSSFFFRKSSFIFLYAFFWVIPRRLNFIRRRFGAFCLFDFHRRVHMKYFIPSRLCRWKRQSVPKRWHTKFWRQEIPQKKAYNIQNTAKVWNQEYRLYFLCRFWYLLAVIFSHGKFSLFLQTTSDW